MSKIVRAHAFGNKVGHLKSSVESERRNLPSTDIKSLPIPSP